MELNRTNLERIYNEVSNSMDMDINVVTATDNIKRKFGIDRDLARILTEAQYLIYPNDTVIFEICSWPDDRNRQRFVIYRWGYNAHYNKEVWGGQEFYAVVSEHEKRVQEQGKKIYYLNTMKFS